MNSSFFMSFRRMIIIYVIIYVFLSVVLIPIFIKYPNIKFIDSNEDYIWPIPGYTTITSSFGYRYAPTSGASTYHSGIDIGAPAGAEFYAVFSGEIVMTEFSRCRGL